MQHNKISSVIIVETKRQQPLKLKDMKKFKKGLTLTKEELDVIGISIKMVINNRMMDGTSPERFKVLKELEERLLASLK